MSVQPIIEPASQEGPAGPVAAAQRMQRLQALIASVEAGPTGFAAALKAAQSSAPTSLPSGAADPTSTGASALLSTAASAPTTTGLAPGASYALASASPTISSTASTIMAPGSAGSATGSYDALIAQAAARNGVDPAVLHGLIQQESGFDPHATSSAGALGLTQLMPGTAASLGVSDPLDPAQSIEGGARYLSEMLRDFGGDTEKALAAYNAGPGAVQRYGGVPPYAETQQYVSKVLGYAAEYRQSFPAVIA